MNKLINKTISIGIAILAAIAGMASLYFVIIKDANTEAMGSLNLTFVITYVMIILAIASIILFAVFQIVSDKKKLIRTLIMLVIAAAIVLVAYFIAPSELSDIALRLEVGPTAYKWVGTALNVTYFTFLGVILAFISSIIYVKIKN